MSSKISGKQWWKKYNQIWKKSYKFDSGPVYGDNDKYIKTKIKVFDGNVNKIFKAKWCQKKKHHVRFDSDFARSCC